MPKLKSHKGTQKRIGVTGSGKPVRVKSWRGHHLEIKSSRRTRRYDGKALIGDAAPRPGQAPPAVPREGLIRWHASSAASPRTSATSGSSTTPRGAEGTRSRLVKPAREALLHALAYATRDRKQRKRQLRQLWIVRINAARTPERRDLRRADRRA